MDEILGRPKGESRGLIRFVKDRPGHDRRYAIDATKIKEDLGWVPKVQMEEGMQRTAQWYLEQKEWLERIINGSYQDYYNNQYNR